MVKIQEVPTTDSDTDYEPLEQVQNDPEYNVFANDLQHSEKSESIRNTCIVKTDDSNVIPHIPDMCDDDIKNDQNDVESDDDRVALANLIANLKLDYMDILIKTCLVPFALKTQNHSFIFVHELKQEMHADLKYVESMRKEIDALESDKAKFLNMYDMILQEYLKAQLQDKNITISELKKLIEKCKGKSVETNFDKPSFLRQPNAQRIPKPSDLVDSDHFACVTKILNGVNARTKKPNVVPISTRNPKGHANKSVATPHKKKVASKSTTQKPKSYYRMLYEKTKDLEMVDRTTMPIGI
uniref:Integrase, catalytic region, zinc finger, CCHC-type, peptidase aspartic, catalytic n=1 Tax=Tanacetum cinerariifolium TaxID=118510 RepID=A0A699IWG7_TANCI|nr:hypothetical protein [Tanacetum cinerariifolium]